MTPTSNATASTEPTQVKETLISIIIAFVLAFVFRAFVIEAFIIPTGSMAPTLMGAHERITSPNSGYTWPVGPWFGTRDNPSAVQGSIGRPMILHDPMTGEEILRAGERRQTGDRILVFKYLRWIYDPKRFDVVVFKAPQERNAAQNYIKRLTGLPGEEIALVDGDVFVREPAPGEKPRDGETWLLPGWKVQRKSETVQRAVWQPVFGSDYEPLMAPPGYRSPWIGGPGDAGWKIAGQRSYTHTAGANGKATLDWDFARAPIRDFYPYNETWGDPIKMGAPEQASRQDTVFAVSDLRMSAGIEAQGAATNASAVLRTRGHEFRADINGRDVTLQMGALGARQPNGAEAPPAAWTTLDKGTLPHALEPRRIVNLEFWHVDQALWLFADGKLVAHGTYDWTLTERISRALSRVNLANLIEADRRSRANTLALTENYPQASLARWEFSSGNVTLHHVAMDRDIHYQSARPGRMSVNERPRGAHPLNPMILGPDQFFVCGDNSPSSLDARLWDAPDPWVARDIDAKEGIVPRKLMIGRAFFVYFPSLIKGQWSPVPMPDFGRMRFIW